MSVTHTSSVLRSHVTCNFGTGIIPSPVQGDHPVMNGQAFQVSITFLDDVVVIHASVAALEGIDGAVGIGHWGQDTVLGITQAIAPRDTVVTIETDVDDTLSHAGARRAITEVLAITSRAVIGTVFIDPFPNARGLARSRGTGRGRGFTRSRSR